MKYIGTFLFVLSCCLWHTACTETEAQTNTAQKPVKSEQIQPFISDNVGAAKNVLAVFDEQIQLDFSDADRTAWSNLPINEYPRNGVALKDMTNEQKQAAHELLRAGLSDLGYLKVNWLFWNDERRREDRQNANNPTWKYYGHNNFWLTIFGEPSMEAPWGWQLEGHHLSVNLTFQDGKVAMTPLFLGADPAIVPDGPYAGLQVLKVETKAGWELIQSMDKKQQAEATIAETPFADILTREGNEAHTTQPKGIAYTALNAQQQQLVQDIIHQYVGTFPEAPAAAYLEKVKAAESDLRFAWAGSTTPGAAIYYRIHAPDFIIEFDNRSGEPNHIHSVWYDLENVFGKSF